MVLAGLGRAQTTPIFNLNVPSTGVLNWGPLVNNNFTSLEAILSGTRTSPGMAFTGPLNFYSGTVANFANECAAIVSDSSGGTVTTISLLRTKDSANVVHDVLCVVTADVGNPTFIGSLIHPTAVSFSRNSAASQGGTGGILESMGTTGGLAVFTNNGGTNRHNIPLSLRGCNGPGPTNCGTDFQMVEDPNSNGKEELIFNWGGDGSPFYTGNVLNSIHPGIWFGGSDASIGAVLGIDRVLGKFSHLTRLETGNTDTWNTVTLTSGTATVTFNRNFTGTVAPVCLVTWQGTGTLTGFLKCTPSGSSGAWAGVTVASTVGTDTAVVGYLILGNP